MSHDLPSVVVDCALSRHPPRGAAIDLTGAIARGFGEIRGTPTTLLIDKRRGTVRRVGGAPDLTA